MKRIFDVIFSSLAILFFSPILIPLMVYLKFSGEGEIFYTQERVGRGGKIFKLYKFATMLKNSPSMATGTITIKNDPRILPAGKFLRNTKINELPQLLNIFLGDMSFIGPRPLTQKNFNYYPVEVQKSLLRVRPGLSGVGSIIFRCEEEILLHESNPTVFYSEVIAPYKGRLEQWYISNQSLKNYLILIFITAWIVIFPKSTLVWRAFPTLAPPPKRLRLFL